MLPYHKYKIEDFERLFLLSFHYKTIENFLGDLEWNKDFSNLILKICKKYIGYFYESNRKNPENIKFIVDNEHKFYLYVFHIIIILSHDDVSENSINYKIKILEKFFYLFSFNDKAKNTDIEDARIFLSYILSIRENFIGYIFYFYLNLPNLLDIKNIRELLNIKKIPGYFKTIYTQSNNFALLDINVRISYNKDNTTIVIDNRDKILKNIFDCFCLHEDDNTIDNNFSLDVGKTTNKTKNSLFYYSRKKYSFENLLEIKELFSSFRFMFYLIYGHFYDFC
jgi:hypothetical protein